MKTKRVLGILLALMLVIGCALAITSCGGDSKKEHAHSYTSAVTAPTCTAKGYTTYTCECGDSYVADEVAATSHTIKTVDAKAPTCTEAGYAAYEKCEKCSYTTFAEIAALGHDFSTTVLKYPTMDEAGKKKHVCKTCAHNEEETINALSVALPEAADIIAAILNDTKYSLAISEGTEFVYTKELSDYTYAEGEKTFVSFELAELVLDGKDETPKGHIKIKVKAWSVAVDGTVAADKVEKTGEADMSGELYIYLNGNNVSMEMVDTGNKTNQECDINELMYAAIAESFGISSEDIATVIHIGSEVVKYIPAMLAMMETAGKKVVEISPEYVEEFNRVVDLVGESFITVTTKDGNTVYTLDVTALKNFLDLIDDKTFAAVIDEVYGEGTVDAIAAFISGLPDAKIGTIVDNAIEFAEGYDVNVEDVYYIINYVIFLSTGSEEFDIENAIAENYDRVLGDVVAELTGAEDKDAFITEMKESISGAVAMFKELSFDGVFAMVIGAPEADLTDALAGIIDTVDEVIALEIVVDKDGAVVSLVATFASSTIEYVATADGGKVTLSVGPYVFEAVVEKNKLTLDILDGEDDYLDFSAIYDEATGNVDVDLIIRDTALNDVVKVAFDKNAEKTAFEAIFNENIKFAVALVGNKLTADMTADGRNYIDFDAIYDEANKKVDVTLVISDNIYSTNSDGDRVFVKFGAVATVKATVTIGDDGKYTAAVKITDKDNALIADFVMTLTSKLEQTETSVSASAKLEFKGTVDGTKLDVVYDVAISANENDYSLNYGAKIKVDDEDVADMSFVMKETIDSLLYDVYVSIGGEVVMDAVVEATFEETENSTKMTLYFDIAKILLDSYSRSYQGYDEGTQQIVLVSYRAQEFFAGVGQIILSIEK